MTGDGQLQVVLHGAPSGEDEDTEWDTTPSLNTLLVRQGQAHSTGPGYVQYGARVCTVRGQGMPRYVQYGARVCTVRGQGMYSTGPGYVRYRARVCTRRGQGMYNTGPGYVQYGARVCKVRGQGMYSSAGSIPGFVRY